MTQVFEFAAFTVHAGHEQALIDERPAMIAALRKAFPGVLADWLTRRDDGSWLDEPGRRRARRQARHGSTRGRQLVHPHQRVPRHRAPQRDLARRAKRMTNGPSAMHQDTAPRPREPEAIWQQLS